MVTSMLRVLASAFKEVDQFERFEPPLLSWRDTTMKLRSHHASKCMEKLPVLDADQLLLGESHALTKIECTLDAKLQALG